MEPFNIKIKHGKKELTLTILPDDKGYFKVIYFGGILGAVYFDGHNWEQVPPADVIAGDLPMYEPGPASDDHEDLSLSEYLVEGVGREIDLYLDEHI